MLEVNSKQSGGICSETWRMKRKGWWEVFAEKKGIKPPFLTITSLKPHCYFPFLTLKKKKLSSIIKNFTLYNSKFNLSTIYLSILQRTNYCCDTTLTHAKLFLRRDKSITH